MLCAAADVTLTLLDRNASMEDIDCPGDMISYLCSIESNSEDLQLTWTVTPPSGCPPFNATFRNSSDPDITNECTGIVVSLTNYTRDVGLASVLTVTVLRNALMTGTEIECGITNLDNEVETLFINTAGIVKNLRLLHM